MLARALRIIRRYPRQTVAVCEACAAKFKSYLPQADHAEWEIRVRFDEHTCKRTVRPRPDNELPDRVRT